jgi:hypothetical protein
MKRRISRSITETDVASISGSTRSISFSCVRCVDLYLQRELHDLASERRHSVTPRSCRPMHRRFLITSSLVLPQFSPLLRVSALRLSPVYLHALFDTDVCFDCRCRNCHSYTFGHARCSTPAPLFYQRALQPSVWHADGSHFAPPRC